MDGAPEANNGRTGRGSTSGQIAARYALSLRTKHKVLVIAHALQAFDAWEVIPPEAVEAVLPAAEKAVGAAVAQDSAALWTSPAEKADIKKRLVMLKQRQSTTAVHQGQEGVAHAP